jgi:hypothetical protein
MLARHATLQKHKKVRMKKRTVKLDVYAGCSTRKSSVWAIPLT